MARIELDPDAHRSTSQQLVDQLRYLIATGHYEVEDSLPSTRKLGDRLGISFHTVRKAYQQLEDEGILRSKVGSGYTVTTQTPRAKSKRIAEGAEVVQEALKTLIGLGLSEAEIEALFQEQSHVLDHAGVQRTLISIGPYPELNALYAEQLGIALQHPVRPVTLAQLDQYTEAAFGFTPYPYLTRVLNERPQGDTLGFVTHLPSSILDRTARLRSGHALGLVTRYQESLAPLSDHVREQTAYGGEIVRASIEDSVEHLPTIVEETDLLLYTPESKRRLLPFLTDDKEDHAEVRVVISQESIDAIVETVPS